LIAKKIAAKIYSILFILSQAKQPMMKVTKKYNETQNENTNTQIQALVTQTTNNSN